MTLTPTLRRRENVDALTTRGVEAGLSVERGHWTFTGSLSWLRARIGSLRPAQVPAFSASGSLRWSDSRTALALMVRHTGRAYDDDLNLDTLPAATTLGAIANRRISRRLTLRLRLENVLDKHIVTRNQSGSIDLGVLRTMWLSMQLRN